MNVTTMHRRMKALDFRTKCPPVITLLSDVYGFSHLDIAREVRRSPNMMTYYISGKTPLPPILHTRLRSMLTRARDILIKSDFENDAPDIFRDAIISLTSHVIDNYARLHR